MKVLATAPTASVDGGPAERWWIPDFGKVAGCIEGAASLDDAF
jgi:hypothetical protein